MSTLIVYFSFLGNNKLMAENMAKNINADLKAITEPKKRTAFTILLDMIFNRTPKINPLTIDWDFYDHVILMSPIWNMRLAHPMKSFIQKERKHFPNYSFASVCGGREGQENSLCRQLTRLVGIPPIAITQFEINSLVAAKKIQKPENVSNHRISTEELTLFKTRKEHFLEIVDTHLNNHSTYEKA